MEEKRTHFVGVGGLGKTMVRIFMREEGMPFDDTDIAPLKL